MCLRTKSVIHFLQMLRGTRFEKIQLRKQLNPSVFAEDCKQRVSTCYFFRFMEGLFLG